MSHTAPPRLEPVVLTGRFVRLEPLEHRHLDDLMAAALTDPAMWAYMPARVSSRSDLERVIDAALEAQRTGLVLPFAVVDLGAERAIGSTRYLDYRPPDRGIEIGWTWYARPAWGTMVNAESKYLLFRHAFETLGCLRVQLKTDERNLRSRAAIARLGAKEEGTLRKHMLVHGTTMRNSVYFSVLDDEWPAVKTGLLERLGQHGSADT
ncbi:MAG: GNAT family N-acetyltransferase [Chloroflexi bacterium]|nr:GNAT family N-acetyltransferase [Chloroflexota bacterium]